MSDNLSELEAYMLSGRPFTFQGACAAFRTTEWRVIDRTIQRLRKRGAIAYTRAGREVVWCRVAP